MQPFNGVRVFSATTQRQTLGATVTAWIEETRRTCPGFQIADIVVRQSSDMAYHCITVSVFYKDPSASTSTAKARNLG